MLEQARSTAEAECADLALRHKRALAEECEAAGARSARECERTAAREAEAAAELACTRDDAARLRADLNEHLEEQGRAAAQNHREREAEARR